MYQTRGWSSVANAQGVVVVALCIDVLMDIEVDVVMRKRKKEE